LAGCPLGDRRQRVLAWLDPRPHTAEVLTKVCDLLREFFEDLLAHFVEVGARLGGDGAVLAAGFRRRPPIEINRLGDDAAKFPGMKRLQRVKFGGAFAEAVFEMLFAAIGVFDGDTRECVVFDLVGSQDQRLKPNVEVMLVAPDEVLNDRLLRDIYSDPNVRAQRIGDQTLVWVDLQGRGQ